VAGALNGIRVIDFGQWIAGPLTIDDYCTGLLGAFGLGLGLLHRLRTGEGQRVETSLGHAATFLQLPYLQTYAGKAWDEPSGPEAKGWGPLQRLYGVPTPGSVWAPRPHSWSDSPPSRACRRCRASRAGR